MHQINDATLELNKDLDSNMSSIYPAFDTTYWKGTLFDKYPTTLKLNSEIFS